MNKLFVAAFVVLMVFASSCTNDDVFVTPTDETVDFSVFGLDFEKKGSLVTIGNVVPGIYNLADKQNSNLSFEVGSFGEAVSSVDLLLDYNGTNSAIVQTINSFPTNISLSLVDACALLGISTDVVDVGDVFTFSFGQVSTGSGSFASGTSLRVDASCPSVIAGVYTAVATVTSQGAGIGWDNCAGNTWTGALSFVEVSSGVYEIVTDGINNDVSWVDASFGAFYACYGTDSDASLPAGNLQIVEKCNQLSFKGTSQWGEVYTFTKVETNGNILTLAWTNDYGEGGECVITSTTDWPALFK